MQTSTQRAACEAIYLAPGIAKADKADLMAHLLGIGIGTGVAELATAPQTATAPSAETEPPRRRDRRARNRRRDAAPPEAASITDEEVYALIPETGGIKKADITLAGARPNQIGVALSRLRKAGRLVEQNGVLFRAPAAARQAA